MIGKISSMNFNGSAKFHVGKNGRHDNKIGTKNCHQTDVFVNHADSVSFGQTAEIGKKFKPDHLYRIYSDVVDSKQAVLYSGDIGGSYKLGEMYFSENLYDHEDWLERYKNHYVLYGEETKVEDRRMSMYEYRDFVVIKDPKLVYVDEDGYLTYVEDVDDFTKKYNDMEVYETSAFQCKRIIPPVERVAQLIENDSLEYALKEYSSQGIFEKEDYDPAKALLIRALIDSGRIEEAFERFPQDESNINALLRDLDLYEFQMGSTSKERPEFGIEPVSLPKMSDLEKRENEINDYSRRTKQQINDTKGFAYNNTPASRFFKNVASVGLYEVVSACKNHGDKKAALVQLNKDVAKQKAELSDQMANTIQQRREYLDEREKVMLRKKENMQIGEEVKGKLQNRFIDLIDLSNKGKPVKFPNCVMLYGGDPVEMRKLIDWTGRLANVRYVMNPSRISLEEMQEDLYRELEKSEEEFQISGKRSLIFVNGMERLLRQDINESNRIAGMKDVMNCANEDYHATIIFYTSDPEKLDPVTTAPHRVGLKIEVPKKYEEIN